MSKSNGKITPEIEAIYRAYPKHVGRAAAYPAIGRAIIKAAREHDEPGEWLLKVVEAYAEFALSNIEAEFIPYPATWFNQERWADEGVAKPVNPWMEER